MLGCAPMVVETDDASSPAGDLRAAGNVDADPEADRVMRTVRHRLFGGEPMRLGRFVVLKRIGEGTSGIVYAGYDPELDRRVAIKVLHGEGSRDRSRHEARAMGRLQHPNVVRVYQLGTDGDRLFVAMEFVEGDTLRAWMDATPRWTDVVDVFLQAGRGLAAAHEAELVHCDFKPANVLITNTGEVRVADFGLAQLGEADTSHAQETSETLQLTHTGTITGTPAYMAPEVFEGGAPTELSDQFSFCVALYEALYGHRPFPGDDLETLSAAVRGGNIRKPPPGTGIPAALRRVVEQGLSVEPERRHESMVALLEALERARQRRNRGMAIGAMLLGLAAAGLVAVAHAAQPEVCGPSDAHLVGVWNPERKQAAQEAFAATSLPYAPDAFSTVAQHLDAFADDWSQMHRTACEATRVHGTQSPRVLDLRMGCLARRRSQLEGLTDVLVDADPAVVERAVQATEDLVPVAVCADVAALEAGQLIPESPALRAEVGDVRRELDGVVQAGAAGRTANALPRARALAKRADELGFGPLRAEVQLELGRLQQAEGALEDAESSLRSAFALALAHGHDEVTAWAAIEATDLVGKGKHEPVGGERWAWLAEPAVERAGRAPGMESVRLTTRANLHWAEGAIDEARKGYEAALELALTAHGARALRVAKVRTNLGAALRRLGHHEEALAQLTEAKAIMLARVGERHPHVSKLLNSIGNLYWSTKDYARSVEHHRKALDLKKSVLRPGHPSLGHSHNNLADALIELGRRDEAEGHYQQALDNWEEALGKNHPLLAYPLRGLGRIAIESGRASTAIDPLERAFDLVMARDNSEVYRAETAWLLAQAIADRDARRSRELAEDALTRLEKASEPREGLVADISAWLKAHPGQQPPPDVSIR